MNFAQIVIIISHLPILLAVVYTASIYNRLSHELKVFSWFIFFSGLIQFVSLAFWFAHRNNMPLLHLYVAGSFLLLTWFYSTLLRGFINKKVLWSVAGAFLVFTTINSIFIQPVNTFNSYALTIESVLILILSLFTFTFFLNNIVKETRRRDIKSLTWINSGLFAYYSSDLLIFYFGAVITQTLSTSLNQYTWVFHSFFSIVMYTCFIIGLWRRSKT